MQWINGILSIVGANCSYLHIEDVMEERIVVVTLTRGSRINLHTPGCTPNVLSQSSRSRFIYPRRPVDFMPIFLLPFVVDPFGLVD
jgi:hypothetical protein